MAKVILITCLLLVSAICRVSTLKCYVCDDCPNKGALKASDLQTCGETGSTTSPPVTSSGTTAAVTSTVSPGTTVTAVSTASPGTSVTPGSTVTPESSEAPTSTVSAGTSETPATSATPGTSETPVSTATPGTSQTPASSDNPGSSETPQTAPTSVTSETAGSSVSPETSETAGSSETPAPGTSETPGSSETPAPDTSETGRAISVHRVRRNAMESLSQYSLERANETYVCVTITYKDANNTEKVARGCGAEEYVPICQNATAFKCEHCHTDGCNSAGALQVSMFLLVAVVLSILLN